MSLDRMEMEFLLDFTSCHSYDYHKEHIRILWSAYCFHHDIEPDTSTYDQSLLSLWNEVKRQEKISQSYDEFYDYMSEFLV